MKKRLTITQVAEKVGVTTRTIKRWEESGKIKKANRDWRGWRVYQQKDLKAIIKFHEMLIVSE
ncbi:MAG: MerR family transcriptional regulator [Candidatus Scalindua sp.]|nr:MerR family transcriptional regulator [Candidatus Scalindua sp.]